MIDPTIASVLGESLAKEISSGALLSKDDTFARFRPYYAHDASGIGATQPPHYWYKEVGYFWRVQSFAESGTLDGDDRAATLLVIHGPNVLGARVPWRVAIAAIRALLAPKTREGRWFRIVATSDDGAYGFVFTAHGGYVLRELHDDETVYKVSRWHPLRE